MNKYEGFSKIVKEYFSAELDHVDFNYSNHDTICIEVEYKDKFYTYSYGIEVGAVDHHVEFLNHDCLNHGGAGILKRNVEYEHQVEMLLNNY